METVNINKNISLHYIKMQKLKTTVVGMYIRRKLKREEAAFNAVLPYVLKSGCKKYTSTREIAKQLEILYGARMGAGVIKNGDNQVIFFDCETISDKYAPDSQKLIAGLTTLLSSVVFEPLCDKESFLADIVEREKNTVKNKINAMINDKRSYAQIRCIEEMCENDAFSISKFGEIEDVDKINTHNLYEHYKKIITSSQIDIFVSGEADLESLTEEIRSYIKDLDFCNCECSDSKIITPANDIKRVTDKLEVTQGKLAIGFTTGISAKDEDYPALVIANSIFGAGTHSKLFMNVREKLSLAYYASSNLNKYKGILTVNAGIEFDNFKKAFDETMLQLGELKKGNISEDEINFSISTIINALNSYYDDQRYMQLYALDCRYLNIEADLEEYKRKLMAVTKDDIIRVSDKIKENTVYFLAGNSQ